MTLPRQSNGREGGIFIQGMAWVTACGTDLAGVFRQIVAGDPIPASELPGARPGRVRRYLPVPDACLAEAAAHPRLRRASRISLCAATAGLGALKNAGIDPRSIRPDRLALLFCTANGGVNYTLKLDAQIAGGGPRAASPLLFPETVFNASAGHLAAILGIDGHCETVVGDGPVALCAIDRAADLLAGGAADYCLVVAAEEVSWIVAEAYAAWRLYPTLAEAGAALLLSRTGDFAVGAVHPGNVFFRRQEAAAKLGAALDRLAANGAPEVVVGGDGGTPFGAIESRVLGARFPGTRQLHPKRVLGEALAAGVVIQTIAACLDLAGSGGCRAMISSLGFTHQAGGLMIARAGGMPNIPLPRSAADP